MKGRKTFILVGIVVIVGLAAFLYAQNTERVEITTYYPSPTGAFSVLRVGTLENIDVTQPFRIGTNLIVDGDIQTLSNFNAVVDATIGNSLGVGINPATTGEPDVIHVGGVSDWITFQFYDSTGTAAGRVGYSNLGSSFMPDKLWFASRNNQDIILGPGTGNVGINVFSPGFKLDVAGTINASAACTCSDIRWKKNIKPLKNSLDKILNLRGIEFQWKVDEFKDMGFKEGKNIGLIAQEVEDIIPEVVVTGDDGYKSLEYGKMVVLLIEAMKEQQEQILNMKSEIDILKSQSNK